MTSRRRQQAAASLTASGNQTVNAYVIHPAKTKHGLRHWAKLEFTMTALTERFPNGNLPERVSSALARWVSKKLGYRVSRQTVIRALEALRAANR
jgi:hypothetical protein